jgi:type IV pilus assembly protein PilY1
MILLRKKYILLDFFLSLFFILIAAGCHRVHAQGLDNCPYPPFSASETGRPNILIILDHSASMGSGAGSHWVTAQEVVKEIIDDFPNVRFGLMRMDASSSRNYVSGIYPNISIEDHYVRQGGKLLKPVGTPGSEIKAYIDNWGPDSGVPSTWTNLAETLATAGQYFATVEVAGSHTGSNDAAILTDSNADFVNDGIEMGDLIFNTTDGSYGAITTVTATSITASLTGGSDNNWDTDDSYTTTKKAGKGPAPFGYYGTAYHPDDPDSQCYYTTGTLSHGEKPWLDLDATIDSQPAEFDNYVAIRTWDNFKENDSARLIYLNLPVPATVYVAYQRGKTIPAWLGESYTLTEETVTTSNGSFDIYANSFGAGPVTLGGNYQGISGDADYTYFAYVSLPGGINDCIASNTDDRGRYLDTTSPIQNKCQQSFTIFITDGEPSFDNDWDIVTDVIGNYDHDSDSGDRKYTGNRYDEGRTNYLDDVAKYLYDKDLRSDIEGKQNLVTYVVGFYTDFALLRQTAANGGGLYFTASNAAALNTALHRTITDILNRVSAGAAVSTITTSAASADYLIRAKFLPLSWQGFLEAFTQPYYDGKIPLWEAGQVLADRIDLESAADREIFTYMGSQVTNKKQEFERDNSTLVEALNSEWSGAGESEIGDIIDFLRGDHSNDGGKYRDRKGWFLGDIISSTPSVVGPPRSFFLENDYQTFKSNNLSRATMIYVGANDGMLHAFSGSNGSEAWSFIPEHIRQYLTNLTLEACHKYYVDLSPTAYDVWDESWRENDAEDKEWTGWKTVLLGGNRLGGEEYFALDITDPAADSVSILWDKVLFSGQKSSTIPFVGKVKVQEGRGGEVDKWLAIITSGYDETDGRTGTVAAVDFTDGSKERIWTEGNSTVTELATQARSGSNPYYTLTSPVGVDSDNDGYLDLIYAGDTEGALWKFYYDYNETLWRKVKLFDTGGQPITARPTLVFDDQQNLRIFFGTGKYLVGGDKDDITQNAYYCLIDRKHEAFRPALDKNYQHYTVAPATPLGPSDLADITLLRTEGELSDYLAELTEAQQQGFIDKRDEVGWYFELDDPAGEPGERVVDESVVVAGVSFFTSFYPNEDICGYGGDARLYAVDYKTGFIATSGDHTTLHADTGGTITERYKALSVGLPSKPVFHRDLGTGVSSIMVQTSDTTVHVETVTLTGKLWGIGSWRTVD